MSSIEYKLRPLHCTTPLRLRRCDCCGAIAPLAEFQRPRQSPRYADGYTEDWLCEVCFETGAAKSMHFPNLVNRSDLMRAIAWGINHLKQEINKRDNDTTT